MSEKKISIIVPVYKCEQYLAKCVDSLLCQTYSNIEIILVDDGSPDKCGDMCDAYASQDVRIKNIHKPNGGLSSARNAGMRQATGDYLMFVDSDDWVEKNFCEKALQVLLQNNVRLVSFGLRFAYTNREELKHTSNPRLMEAGEALCHTINDDEPIYNYVCNKIFDRHLFEGIEFPEGKNFEDIAVMYKLIDKAENVYVAEHVLYNYLQRDGSITSSYNSLRSIRDRFAVWQERLPFLKNKYHKAYLLALGQCTNQAVDILVHFWKSGKLTQKAIRFLKEYKQDILPINSSHVLQICYNLRLI